MGGSHLDLMIEFANRETMGGGLHLSFSGTELGDFAPLALTCRLPHALRLGIFFMSSASICLWAIINALASSMTKNFHHYIFSAASLGNHDSSGGLGTANTITPHSWSDTTHSPLIRRHILGQIHAVI